MIAKARELAKGNTQLSLAQVVRRALQKEI
jgi:hypothetical protein